MILQHLRKETVSRDPTRLASPPPRQVSVLAANANTPNVMDGSCIIGGRTKRQPRRGSGIVIHGGDLVSVPVMGAGGTPHANVGTNQTTVVQRPTGLPRDPAAFAE